MLDDKFINYISGYKSPFEEDEIDNDEIVFDGLMRYYRDCMLASIGTNESVKEFLNYWEEFIPNCTEEQKSGFLKSCIDKIIKHYKMSYLSAMINENNYSDDELQKFVLFVVYHHFLKFFPRCMSYMDQKILGNEAMIKVFVTSDYDSFIEKLDQCKRCNFLIREYFKYCMKSQGIDTLIQFLKDDILQHFIEQTEIYKLKSGVIKNDQSEEVRL